MDYATTLEVVRLAEKFHGTYEENLAARRFEEIGAERRRICATLPPEAELLFRRLTNMHCLTSRPDLAEHFLDGNLSG